METVLPSVIRPMAPVVALTSDDAARRRSHRDLAVAQDRRWRTLEAP
jgi:hypothetical protein